MSLMAQNRKGQAGRRIIDVKAMMTRKKGAIPSPLSFCIRAVLVGRLQPLGNTEVPTGIAKLPVSSAVEVSRTGLTGDQQGDQRHHGGPEKAISHYAFDHYAAWTTELRNPAAVLERSGAFGENFSTIGLTETNICIGDIWRAGTALLQVSQGRQPCWRLNHRFAIQDMAWRVQESLRTGWYYRVLEEGRVGAGDSLVLVERSWPEWTLDRVLRVLYVDCLDLAGLLPMAELPPLAQSWRNIARARLESGNVEEWSARLVG